MDANAPAEDAWGDAWGDPGYFVTSSVTIKAMMRVASDLAASDAEPIEGRVRRWANRLYPWIEMSKVEICDRRDGRTGAGPIPHQGGRRGYPGASPAAGLGVPARAEVAAVLDSLAGTAQQEKPVTWRC